MKNTVFLALVFAAATVHAQKSYPSCLLADCVNFLTITVGCGYSDTNLAMSSAQLACICGSSSGPKEYQNCTSCLILDPANTVNYPAQCSGSVSVSTKTSSVTRSSSVSISSATSVRSASGAGQPASQTVPAPTPTAPVTPAAIGGGLQAFGGCPNGDCSGGDSTKANIYDVSKDSNAVSGARGAAGAGRGAWYGTGAGMAVLAGLVWL